MDSKELKNDDSYKKAQKLADIFAEQDGRRPRIMLAQIGEVTHNLDVKVVATAFADIGFDVDIAPNFQTSHEVAKQAIENDVHILGISSFTEEHKTIVPQVIAELKKYGRDDIMVIVGGGIPKQDYQFLFDAGVATIFEPSKKINDTAITILGTLIEV